MSTFTKLINKILTLDKELRFQELAKCLEYIGYTMNQPKGESSHYAFRKLRKLPITIPKGYPIKKVYVKMVRGVILEHENGGILNNE